MTMDLSSLSRRLALCLIGLAPLALAGCGRKAQPKPPQDADPLAPRVYPVDRQRRDDELQPPPPPPELIPTPLPPPPVIR
jgi:hypothetical protein